MDEMDEDTLQIHVIFVHLCIVVRCTLYFVLCTWYFVTKISVVFREEVTFYQEF